MTVALRGIDPEMSPSVYGPAVPPDRCGVRPLAGLADDDRPTEVHTRGIHPHLVRDFRIVRWYEVREHERLDALEAEPVRTTILSTRHHKRHGCAAPT